jgi:hypothetical protein
VVSRYNFAGAKCLRSRRKNQTIPVAAAWLHHPPWQANQIACRRNAIP